MITQRRIEDGAGVVVEFYPLDREALDDFVASTVPWSKPELADKLRQKTAKSLVAAADDAT